MSSPCTDVAGPALARLSEGAGAPASTPRRNWLIAALAASSPWLARPVFAAVSPSPQALRIIGPWEINGLEPANSGYLFARMQVAETLTSADDAGLPLPGLAARWHTSPDGLTWQFVLRPLARFHDGEPVSAAQVALVLQRAAKRPGLLRIAPLRNIEANEGAVVIRLTSPFGPLPAVLSHSSTLILAASAFDAQGNVTRIVGSGPYRVASLEPQGFAVTASDHFDGRQPAIKDVRYLTVGRAETRVLMAEARQAEVALGLDPAGVQRLRQGTRARVEAVTIPRTVILKVNAGHRWLADPRARQAISLALNRGGIARALLRDADLAASQLFPPFLAEWHAPQLAPLRMEPARALALWSSMGWQRGSDGIWQRDGERLALTLRTFPDRPELPLIAAAVQEQLRQTGVAVKVLIGNSGEIPARHRDGSLELALAARNYGLVPDPIITLLQDFGPRGGDWGAMNWHSASLQEALAALTALPAPSTHAATTADSARRAALRQHIAGILHEELPVIPISWYRQAAAVSPDVHGVTLDPLERSYRISQMRWADSTPAGTR